MAVVHLSPELPRLTVRGHKREPSEPIDLLSASPAVVANGDDSSGSLQRSYSGRPRSSSSSSTSSQASSSKQRKSLRLSRPASWINKTKQGGDGTGHNRSSASDADNATTQQIDSAFTKIKEQLAKLSEEDEVLKERVDKLNEEVNVLNTSTALRHLHTQRGSGHQTNVSSIPWKSASFSGGCHSRMPSSPSSVPLLLVSSSSQDHLDRLEEVEAVQNNQTVLHCTAINGIVENPGVIGIDSAIQNADSSTKSTVLHNLSPLPIS